MFSFSLLTHRASVFQSSILPQIFVLAKIMPTVNGSKDTSRYVQLPRRFIGSNVLDSTFVSLQSGLQAELFRRKALCIPVKWLHGRSAFLVT